MALRSFDRLHCVYAEALTGFLLWTEQAKLAAAMEVAEANAQRAEEIQAAADAAQERFAQVCYSHSAFLSSAYTLMQRIPSGCGK